MAGNTLGRSTANGEVVVAVATVSTKPYIQLFAVQGTRGLVLALGSLPSGHLQRSRQVTALVAVVVAARFTVATLRQVAGPEGVAG